MGKKIDWDDEFILRIYPGVRSMRELMDAYNATHPQVKLNALIHHCTYKLGINRAQDIRRAYTDDEERFLRDTYPVLGGEETTRLFNEMFGRGKSVMAIRAHCQQKGISINDDVRVRVRADGVRKYHENHVTPEMWKQPRVKDENGNWVYKARYLYEKEHGKLEKGMVVIHLNCDSSDYSLDNLYAIPNRYLTLMNKYKLLSADKRVTLAGVKWCELYAAMGYPRGMFDTKKM